MLGLVGDASRGVAGQEAHRRCNRFRFAQSTYCNLREQDVALAQIVIAVKGFKSFFCFSYPQFPHAALNILFLRSMGRTSAAHFIGDCFVLPGISTA